MINNREAFIKLLFSPTIEGGVSNHPADPGKLTNYGITKATLADWRAPNPVTDEDVKTLSLTEAEEIIWLRYWNPIRANDMPGGLDVYLCDFTVNSGRRNAVATMQKLLGFEGKEIDGIVGPATLQAVSAQKPLELLTALHRARMAFLRGLSTWDTFGKGWSNRCQAMVEFSANLLPKEAPAAVARADKVKRYAATVAATVGTAITTATASVPLVIAALPAAKEGYSQMQSTLAPFAEVAPWLMPLAGAATVAGILWLAVRNGTMSHNARVTGTQANIVAEPRIPQEAAT